MILPTTLEVPKDKDPGELVIFSHTKVGKTTLVEGLPNHLLIDLEGGSKYVTACKVDVNKMAVLEGKSAETILKEISTSIKEEIAKTGKSPYDFIVLDTATELEIIARRVAVVLYKNTLMGKDFKGRDVVAELPNGAGYDWLRKAYEMLYDLFRGCANKSLILLGHVKTASINKDGKDIQAQDVALTGKLKMLVCKDADSIGFMYRNEKNQNILSFKTSVTDLASGSRSPHLRNQEIVISELVEDGTVKVYWDRVYTSLK